jgi:uncharacterized protein (DUF302 family)
MYYIVETKKEFQQAAADLEAAVKKHGFGVLRIHDLGATLPSKGIAFEERSSRRGRELLHLNIF